MVDSTCPHTDLLGVGPPSRLRVSWSSDSVETPCRGFLTDQDLTTAILRSTVDEGDGRGRSFFRNREGLVVYEGREPSEGTGWGGLKMVNDMVNEVQGSRESRVQWDMSKRE